MNLLELILKQMRQRALGTWLTMLSVLLGVALATAVLIVYRESDKLFGQSEFGYDVLVGAKGSPLQLVLNTVYGIERSPGNIPYSIYEDLARPRHPRVKLAIPISVGDSYEGFAIVGTVGRMFGADDEGRPLVNEDPEKIFQYRPGKHFRLTQGRVFHSLKFEAIIGSEVAKRTGLTVGGKFKSTHGTPAPGEVPDVHDQEWEIVGILEQTRTAADKNLFIPLVSFYAIDDHGEALEAQHELRASSAGIKPQPASDEHAHAHDEEPVQRDPLAPDEEGAHDRGTDAHALEPQASSDVLHDHDHDHAHSFHIHEGLIHLEVSKEQWSVSAIYVRSRGGAINALTLMYEFNNRNEATAVNPAMVMRDFFSTFLAPGTMVLMIICVLVSIVAAVGILVSIYNSVAARRQEIAILRALGATRGKILTLLCAEATLIGIVGGIAGLIAGHLLAGAGSAYAEAVVGQRLNWIAVSPYEWIYLGGVVLLSLLAGLVPAAVAYRTPVASNLAPA